MRALLQWAVAPKWDGLKAFLLGLLTALALPPLNVVPVLFLTFPGLLALIGRSPGGVRGWWASGKLGFWFGFGLHLIGLYWITEAILLESARYWWFVPLAVPALSALLALFIAAPCALTRAVPAGWRRVAMLAGAWTLFDLARQFVGTGFPWNPLGSVWELTGAAGDVMIQPAAWVGTPGLTLMTVLLAGAASLGWRGGAGIVVVLAGWIGLGLWRLYEPDPPGPGLDVVLVQGDIQHGSLFDRASAVAAFNRELRLSHDGVEQAGTTPSVVVWPESGGIFLLDEDPAARAAIADAIKPARGAIIGALRFSPQGSRDGAPYNSEMAMDGAGTITGVYDKWHLVPFGEFAPSWVPLSIQIVPGQFAFGTGPKTLEIPGVPPFGGLICYEAIYPGQVVDEANRPDWLVNVTNDSWFGNSTGPRQHLAGVRMRAVEEGLPIMRAALTGISAGFDARGRELGRLGVGVTGQLTLPLPPKRPPTSFSRWGLVIPSLLASMVVLFAIWRPGKGAKHL